MASRMEDQVDIAPLMPTIEAYARKANIIVELGCGHGNGSTRALMRGFQGELMVSVDHDPERPAERPDDPRWKLVHGDTRHPDTALQVAQLLGEWGADLILVDTDHTYEQLKQELEVWFPLAHEDTIWLFHDTWMLGKYNKMTDAIKEFVDKHPWLVYEDLTHESNGLGMMRPFLGINAGSGQRPFAKPWINIEAQEKWRKDTEAKGCKFTMGDVRDLPYDSFSVDMVVSHHCLEHCSAEDADAFVDEAFRVLRPGGSLLVFVPNMRALAQRWLTHQMNTQLYMINVYGAWMGSKYDRHRQGFDPESLRAYLKRWAWSEVKQFNRRPIAGADIAGWDWWILDMECVK